MSQVQNPDALAQLALQDLQNGRIAAAEAKCLQVLGTNNRHPRALMGLGMVLHAQGRHEDAVRVFNALTLFEPANPQHWTNLGVALRPLARYDQAVAAFEHATTLGDRSTDLLYNLGLAHIDRCDYDAAYELLCKAVDLAPTDAGVRSVFANCCYDMLRFEEALAALENWQALEGLNADIVGQIAYFLVTMGELKRAESAIAWLTGGTLPEGRAALTLSRVLERLNRLEQAKQVLARVKHTPGFNLSDPDLLLAEGVIAQREDAHEDARQIFAHALRAHTDMRRRHHLLFPQARSFDALGRYEEAFVALEEAHRSQIAFIEAATGKTPADASPTMVLAATGCEPADLERWDAAGAPSIDESPIFVVAFPRSGTTLLEQTLDAHPALRSMDEQPFLKQALADVVDSGIQYPSRLADLTPERLDEIRARYWERVRKKVVLTPGQRLVDKNPLNLLRVPLIHRLFPNARTIVAIRHPCDTLLSCFIQHFRAPDLALLCRDLPTLVENFRRAFDYWYSQSALLASPRYELKYESLVDNFEGEIRKLCEFIELPFNAAMLAPGGHALAKGFISTPSYAQVIQPVNSRSVGRWKNYERHFAAALAGLEPLIRRWGYPL